MDCFASLAMTNHQQGPDHRSGLYLFCENRFHCASGQKIEPESTTMHRKAKCFKNLLDHQSPDRSILGRATIRNSAYCPAAI
jgi:hypothetical protein